MPRIYKELLKFNRRKQPIFFFNVKRRDMAEVHEKMPNILSLEKYQFRP